MTTAGGIRGGGGVKSEDEREAVEVQGPIEGSSVVSVGVVTRIVQLSTGRTRKSFAASSHPPPVSMYVYYCRTYIKAVRGDGGLKRGHVCYGMLRAAACVDESDHHALMYVRHGQTV